MIAERIRCTQADLSVAYRMLSLRSSDGLEEGPSGAAAISPDSELVAGDGSLTAIAQMVLPVLARPERIISVSAVTVGQTAVDSAVILAPHNGGPFVLRGDRDEHVDLVVLDSPTAAVSLLDQMMMITGLPTTSAAGEVQLDRIAWVGLLAATDAERVARLESQLARNTDSAPTFDAARLDHLIDQALGADDSRWILGAEALVDRASVEAGAGAGQAALSGLVTAGLAEFTASDIAALNNTGRAWAEMLSTFVRLSHVRILQVFDGDPVDVAGMAFFRSPTDVVVAQIGSTDVRIMSLHADVAAATLRAAIEGATESGVGEPATRTGQADPSSSGESAGEWIYVLDPVEVRGLYETSAIAGMLEPGNWYLRGSEEDGWARVADADGTLEGWAPAAMLHGQAESPPVEDTPPAPVRTPAWSADHVVPPDGAPVWATPDPAAAAVASLPGGTEVRALEALGAWTHVQSESGIDGWVDGRRLEAVTAPASRPWGAAAPVAPTRATPSSPVDAAVESARAKPVQLIAALALVVSAFLPWFGDFAGSFDLPVAFLWSLEPGESSIGIGLLILVVGLATLATVLVEQLNRYQQIAGGIATGIAAIWLIQTFRSLLDWEGGAFGTALADMFTEVLSFGPWVALAAGIMLLVKR